MPNNPYGLTLSRFSTHQRIIDLIGKDRKVLDVGCNDGYLGVNSDKSNEFYGLDYLESAVSKAKQPYKDAAVYDLNKLAPLNWEIEFEIIIFADVLEHVLEPEKVLRFFVDNYLIDKGGIIISLPNIANWQIRLKLIMGIFDYKETGIMDKTHLHLYTYKTAIELAKTANLDVRATYGGASFFGPVLRIFPFLRPLLATSIILVCEK